MGANYSSQVFSPPDQSLPIQEELEIVSGERNIPCFFSEWKGRSNTKAHFTILYSYGTYDDLSLVIPWLKILRDVLHVNVLGYEYVGYGQRKEQGAPSEQQCYNDISALYQWLVFCKSIPSETIIIMGKDIGTGSSIELASHLYTQLQMKTKRKSLSLPKSPVATLRKRTSTNTTVDSFAGFAGLILINSMTSILNLRSEIGGLYPDMFQNVSKIHNVHCPTLFIHSRNCFIDSKHSFKLSKLIDSEYSWEVCVVDNDFSSASLEEDNDSILDKLIEFCEFLSPFKIKQENKQVQASIPEQFRNSPKQIIEEYLKKLDLEEHVESFLAFGFFDLEAMNSINEVDLDMMSIDNEEHRERLLHPQTYLNPHPLEPGSPMIESADECNNCGTFSPKICNTIKKKKIMPKKIRTTKKEIIDLPDKCEHGVEDQCHYCLCEQDPDYIPPAPRFAERCSLEEYNTEYNITKKKLSDLNQYLIQTDTTLPCASKTSRSSVALNKIFPSSSKRNSLNHKENKLNSKE